jgi:hypothetical protein
LLLIRADSTPGAAAVDRDIARHSGRVFLVPSDVMEADELEVLRQDADRMTTRAVIDQALGELGEVAASRRRSG